MDLNHDGVAEEIMFELIESDEYNSDRGTLIIDGERSEEIVGNLSDGLWVVDLDEEDDYKELIIHDNGPSDDHSDTYFYYDGMSINTMGTVVGAMNADWGAIRNYIEDSVLHSVRRSDVVGTNWYNQDYILDSNHKLKALEQDLYHMAVPVTAKEPGYFYTEKNRYSDLVDLEKDQSFLIISSDLKEWLQVRTEDDRILWLNSNDYASYNLMGLNFYD